MNSGFRINPKFVIFSFGLIFVLIPVLAKPRQPLFHFEGQVWAAGSYPATSAVVTFKNHQSYRTTTTEKGLFSVELPVGVYSVDVDPQKTIHKYLGPIFRVTSPMSIKETFFLRPYTDCNYIASGPTEPEFITCGGAQAFPIPSKDGTPFEVLIEYFTRRKISDSYLYSAERTSAFGPVSLYYNLFSLHADRIEFNTRTHDVVASGEVSGNNEDKAISGTESVKVHLEDGQASIVASPEK